jgi:hypothetical protein
MKNYQTSGGPSTASGNETSGIENTTEKAPVLDQRQGRTKKRNMSKNRSPSSVTKGRNLIKQYDQLEPEIK